jgi:hypothetical protein
MVEQAAARREAVATQKRKNRRVAGVTGMLV